MKCVSDYVQNVVDHGLCPHLLEYFTAFERTNLVFFAVLENQSTLCFTSTNILVCAYVFVVTSILIRCPTSFVRYFNKRSQHLVVDKGVLKWPYC